MGRYNFQGVDVESVRPEQLDFITEVLENKGFIGPDVTFEAVGTAADNLVANVKRVVIKENGSTFKMIAKMAPEYSIMRNISSVEVQFCNEHVIYTEILPKFKELQKTAGVPEEKWFRFAECYGSYTKFSYEVILLEDMREANYVMLDRFKPITDDCVKIVLKDLAIFHSLSYVLKYKEPETFMAFKLKLQNFAGHKNVFDEAKKLYRKVEEGILSVLQDNKYKKLIKGSASEIFHHAEEAKKCDTVSKYSVIQHGDVWTNNILFKMKGETPEKCALIDYQMAAECSPVYDVMYFLFNSTTHEQRQKHYYEFLDYYHREMGKSLHNYGLEANVVYPRDQLDAELKSYAKVMLAASVLVTNFTTKKAEDASQFRETKKNTDKDETIQAIVAQDQETVSIIRSKIEGLVESFLEFGLLDL